MDVPDEFTGNVIDRLSQRKGELQAMTPLNAGHDTSGIYHSIPWTDWIPRRIYDRHKKETVSSILNLKAMVHLKEKSLIVNKALSLLSNPAKQLPTVF